MTQGDLFDSQRYTRPTKSLAPIDQQIRSLRAAHPDWSHKDIGKAVKRAASVVARVLDEARITIPKERDKVLVTA